jgi:hypothetical protein
MDVILNSLFFQNDLFNFFSCWSHEMQFSWYQNLHSSLWSKAEHLSEYKAIILI